MKLLLAHNYYRQRGGEARSFENEREMLRSQGHEVLTYVRDSEEIAGLGRLHAGVKAVWNRKVYQEMRELLRAERPDLVHFHNTFPLISPSAYDACTQSDVPVVQTLHNYRLLCPVATFFRDGNVCEDCLGKVVPWPGVLHACYRGSRIESAAVATMLAVHNTLRTYVSKVDTYIALTEFAKGKFIKGGLPAEKIRVAGNHVARDPGKGSHGDDFVLFVGRLTIEKGVLTLFRAWERLRDIPLVIVGDGPLAEKASTVARRSRQIEYRGEVSHDQVIGLMKSARLLVFPSEWYEGQPNIILEACACGLPLLASRHGSMEELVIEHETGLLFPPGNVRAMQDQIRWLWDHPTECRRMGNAARRKYMQHYTADAAYSRLMQIFEGTMKMSSIEGRGQTQL